MAGGIFADGAVVERQRATVIDAAAVAAVATPADGDGVVAIAGGVSADGAVIYQRVSGAIYARTSGSLKEWDGELTVESGEPPSLFEGFVVTDKGRKAKLSATRVTLPSNAISFRGSGPPPFDFP